MDKAVISAIALVSDLLTKLARHNYFPKRSEFKDRRQLRWSDILIHRTIELTCPPGVGGESVDWRSSPSRPRGKQFLHNLPLLICLVPNKFHNAISNGSVVTLTTHYPRRLIRDPPRARRVAR